MAQQKTSLDIWFSYAGEQQPLLTSIVDYMTANEDDLRETVFTLDEETDFTALKGVRFLPKRYKSEDEQNKPHFRLPPGGDINALVEDIGKSFIKVIVLSKGYFKSPVCMRELCISLCSFHIKRGVFPLFLLVGFKNTENFFTAQTFKFQLKPNSSPVTKTLADALRIVHEDLEESEWKKVRGFDTTPSAKKAFQSILNSIENNLFIEERVFTSTDGGFLPFNGRRSKKHSQTLATDIYRFNFYSLKKLKLSCHQELMKRLYEHWKEDEFAGKLTIAHQKYDAVDFTAINSITEGVNYLNRTKTILNTLKKKRGFKKEQAISAVLSLVGLLALQLTPTLDAALFSYFGGANAVIEIKVRSTDTQNFTAALQTAVAFAASAGVGVRFRLIEDNFTLGLEHVKGVIFPQKLNIGNDVSTAVWQVLRELIRQIFPGVKCNFTDLNSLLNEDRNLIRQLHIVLTAFAEASRNNDIAALESTNFAIIACKRVLDESNIAANQLISEIEKIINDEQEEQAHLPFIILSEHASSAKQSNFSVRMTTDICGMIEYQLREIVQILQG